MEVGGNKETCVWGYEESGNPGATIDMSRLALCNVNSNLDVKGDYQANKNSDSRLLNAVHVKVELPQNQNIPSILLL